MDVLEKTVFYDCHRQSGAQLVEFGGWEMPVQYADGIVREHLATRKQAGLFDVSHMGRFIVGGRQALAFLQHLLTNNAAALEILEGQYTMIPNEAGGAIDDAYLYRFVEDEYLLVVNAANRKKDWDHLLAHRDRFPDVALKDKTFDLAMLSLQGPMAKKILSRVIDKGPLPEPMRNSLSVASTGSTQLMIARTGYTGEPICFELFFDSAAAAAIWGLLLDEGAVPVGLGARDTLRLEAGLPLYGHELGLDPEGREIPIFACPLARFAVSFSPLKKDYIGRQPLARQFEAFKAIRSRDFSRCGDLPRIVQPVALKGKGVARAGSRVFAGDQPAGFITSGTMVPYWKSSGSGLFSKLTDEKGMRAIGLALIDSHLVEGDTIEVEIRGRRIEGVVVPYHLRSEAPPYARAIPWDQIRAEKKQIAEKKEVLQNVQALVDKAIDNTRWRQKECVNLIPSEQTASLMTRMLSILDPAGRYAEHKPVKAFMEADVFYYQGTDFIDEVEHLLACEFQRYLGCAEVETRLISGQMANMAIFSAMVDYVNRADRKSEQRRIRKIMNNHIIKGGHLSAQPMGALRDYVMRDPQWERPAVVNFPVLVDNPYKIDIDSTRELIARHQPELIILGKSMIIHREPVAEIRETIDELSLDCMLMYDMAHVLGLVGPHFQQPFDEGADMVTGSTHKTYFGTQRGIAAVNFSEEDPRYEFWEALQRRAFPGSLSNHHLGTLLGLLMSAYEMNHFRDVYQKSVIENAKTFARALAECGLKVAGDAALGYTETHQVILNVGFGKGPEVARRLEENNIVLNYQAAPDEEGFTASGSLRMGVQEMTRFGMGPGEFTELAQLMAAVIREGKTVRPEVKTLRRRFEQMQYCFTGQQVEGLVERLHQAL